MSVTGGSVLAWATILLGIPVGALLARLSQRWPIASRARSASPARVAGLALSCAVLAAWAAQARSGPEAVVGAFLAWQLLLLAVLDAEHFWLPRLLTLTLISSGLTVAAVQGGSSLMRATLGAALGWFALAAVALVYRRLRGHEGLGGGDAWLLAGGGAWAGWMALPTILVWAAGLGLVVVGIMALKGRRLRAR